MRGRTEDKMMRKEERKRDITIMRGRTEEKE